MTAKDKKTGLYALKPGDRVQVFDINGARMGQPRGGWDGTVVKVGRTLIHVDYPGQYGRGPKAFRLDDGRANDNYRHQSLRTVERAAADMHRMELCSRLRAAGIDLRMGYDFSIETLEALVAALDATAETTED